tara:strand:+ start:13698 stop:13913 length:216 start_codon:yes stop_codon:yes gene_type:complete
MKGGGGFLIILLVLVIAVLGYYNYQQQVTIELLNEEVFEQARLRHEVVLEKHGLQLKIENLQKDTSQVLLH